MFLGAYLYPYIPGHDLPWCAVRIGTGFNCPGCGITRSLSALLHGGVRDSFRYHPLGMVVMAGMVWLWFKRTISPKTGIIFVVALLAVWLARLFI